MTDITTELQALVEREKIRNSIINLARGEDRRNAELITASYWRDSTTDYGVFKGSFDEYLAWVIPGSPLIPVTQHILGQSFIDLQGEVALVETHVSSYHRVIMGSEQRDTVIGGRYLDRLEKRNGEWRIAQRTMLYDWFQDFGASVDWSQGVMGMQFSGDHFTGRAVDDYSDTFLAKQRPASLQATGANNQMDSTVHGAPLAEEQHGALTLGGFLREVCQKNRDKDALVFHPTSGPVVRLSYAQLWDEAFTIARALVARGVTKETRVGLLATNRPEWITSMFGICLAGGTCVALSTFAKGAELEYMLRVADVSFLIFERSVLGRDFAEEIAEFCPELSTAWGAAYSTHLPFLRQAVCIDDMSLSCGAIESWPEFINGEFKAPASLIDAIAAEIAPSDRGMVFFSSGSTAKPKGIVQTHRAATLQFWRWPKLYALDSDVRVWTANGFFWSGNFTQAIGAALSAGGCLVLQRIFVPDEALRLMETERVSLPVAWPHQWARLAEDPAFNEVDLSSLRYVGENSPIRTHLTVQTNWQEPWAAYGSSETLTYSAVHPSGTDPAIVEGNHGFPLPGNTFKIINPMTGDILPRGEAGEIAVKGPTLMVGYLRMTLEETFDDTGFFRTGDGGFFDAEGRLHWQGRLNDIIKTGGANVSPLEIDEVLRECPGVKIAATVGVPHDTLGEIVVACIVPEDGVVLEESAVRAFVSGRLSSYKVPRRVLFVAESDLTLTSSNKVKTAPLRELAARHQS